ncbi:MAG: hypothetical protein ACTS3F_05825 [Phycisphaerales bacterium]
MKAFWSLILALFIATGALLALRAAPPRTPPNSPTTGHASSIDHATPGPLAGARTPRHLQEPLPARIPPDAAPSGTTATSPPGAPTDTPAPTPSTSTDPIASPANTLTLPDHPAPALGHLSDPATVSDWLDDLLEVDHTPTVTLADAADRTTAANEPPPPPLPAPAPMPGVDPNDPNTLAGRFPLRGEGTRDDPYRLPWEALVAVRETYRPRTGNNELPEWLDRIDGKYIALTGYLLLPLVQDTTDEVLLMRNQWDGCCIGVPPTPYDAIEVKLNKPLAGKSSWRMNYGTITGKVAVDPYIVSGWLIGLYLMDDATLLDAGL